MAPSIAFCADAKSILSAAKAVEIFADVSFPDGVTATVEIPIGWTAGEDKENCFIALNGASVCFRHERSGGLTPCQWLNLASPYIDAPGDAKTRIDLIPLTVRLPNSANAAACRGRIISPRFKTINYRMIINAGDGWFYSLSTTPVYWNKEDDARFVEGFEQQLRELEDSIVLKKAAATEEKKIDEPKTDIREEYKTGARAAAVERVEPKEKSPEKSAGNVKVKEARLTDKEKLEIEKKKETAQLEKKLLTAPAVEIASVGRPENQPEALTRRPVFSEVKNNARFINTKPFDRSEFLINADRLRLKGLLQEAREEYSALLPSFQYDSILGLGDVAMAEGDMDAAKKQYEAASRIDPNLPHAYNGLGSVALAAGDANGALKYFQKALELDESAPGTYVNLGWAALTRGKLYEAETLFMKALALKPDLDAAAGAINGLTTIAFNYNEYDEAIRWNSSLLTMFPDYPEARANLVRAYMMKGDGESAAGEARRLESVAQRIPSVITLAGKAYMMAGMLDIAADRLCRYADPTFVQYMPEVVPDCVNNLEKIARAPEALDILAKAAAVDGAQPEIFLMLGSRIDGEGDPAKALETVSAALKKYPDNQQLKDMYMELKKKVKSGRNKVTRQ